MGERGRGERGRGEPEDAERRGRTEPNERRDRRGPAESSVPWGSSTLWVVLASTLAGVMGLPLVSPALPAIRDAFVLTDARVSLLITAYTVPGIVLSPVMGMFADRLGRRRILIPCLFVFAAAGSVTALSPSFEAVLGLRVVQGAAASGIFALTVTLIGDVFEGVERNTVLGLNAAVWSVGAAIYPFLGGVLAADAWSTPFVAYLVGGVVGLFALRMLREPGGERETRGLAYFRGALSALPTDEVLVLYGAGFGAYALYSGAVLTTLPLLLDTAYGLTPTRIGAVLTIALLATAVVSLQNGRLARRFTNHQLVAASFVCYGLSLVGAGLAPSPPLVTVAALSFGVGLGLAVPSIDAAVSQLAPARFRSGALSLRTSAIWLGVSVGPLLFTAAAARTSYRLVLLSAGTFTLVSGAAAVALSLDR